MGNRIWPEKHRGKSGTLRESNTHRQERLTLKATSRNILAEIATYLEGGRRETGVAFVFNATWPLVAKPQRQNALDISRRKLHQQVERDKRPRETTSGYLDEYLIMRLIPELGTSVARSVKE